MKGDIMNNESVLTILNEEFENDKTGEKVQDFDDVKDDLISTLEKTKQTTLMKDLYTKYDVQLKS